MSSSIIIAKHATAIRFRFPVVHSYPSRRFSSVLPVQPAPPIVFLLPPPSLVSSSLDSIKALHGLSITTFPLQPLAILHSLISGYAAQGDLRSAREVFDRMPQRNAVSYNSLIAAYARRDCVDEAAPLLPGMMRSGLRPTPFTFAPILSISRLGLDDGIQLHSLILKSGFLNADPFSGTALLGFYGRNRRLDDSLYVFEEMPCKTLATWNSIICVFSQLASEEACMVLFRQLLRTRIRLSETSFLSILSAFSIPDSLAHVEQIHGLAIKISMDSSVLVANSLIHVLCNCSRVYAAEKLFNDLKFRDVVSWNTLISGFTKSDIPERSLELFLAMLANGIPPTEASFASVVNACVELDVLEYGQLMHAKVMKHNLVSGIFMSSSLIDFYASTNRLSDAHKVFNEIPEKSAASWNALISGYYSSDDDSSIPMILLKQMLLSEVRPNEYTFSSLLKLVSLSELSQLQSLIIRIGFDSNQYVSSAVIASYDSHGIDFDSICDNMNLDQPLPLAQTNVLTTIYNKAGRFQESKDLLLRCRYLDNVSWNILLTASARNGNYSEAFLLFNDMRLSGHRFDEYTAMNLVSCSSKIGSLILGKSLHALVIKTNSGYSDTFVCNALLDMYAKCGDLEGCLNVFQETNHKNLISWTALISGLGLNGHPREALARFRQMEMEGYEPDQVTLLAVLSACKHGGLVEEGLFLFQRMKSDYNIEPEMEHYICLVELLCKYGHLKEAELLIADMPFQPNPIIWRIYLQGCNELGNSA